MPPDGLFADDGKKAGETADEMPSDDSEGEEENLGYRFVCGVAMEVSTILYDMTLTRCQWRRRGA